MSNSNDPPALQVGLRFRSSHLKGRSLNLHPDAGSEFVHDHGPPYATKVLEGLTTRYITLNSSTQSFLRLQTRFAHTAIQLVRGVGVPSVPRGVNRFLLDQGAQQVN